MVILRGRRNIWRVWRVTFVAPRIVNDVSYVTRIKHACHFLWQAQDLVKVKCHFSWHTTHNTSPQTENTGRKQAEKTKTEEACKIIVWCEAPSKFRRRGFQHRRFARRFCVAVVRGWRSAIVTSCCCGQVLVVSY